MPWIGAVATVAGALISSQANKKAADAQAKSAESANALQQYMYDTTRADNAPWREAGQNALMKLTGLLNDGSLTSRFAGKLDNEAGYQFALKEGRRAIDNSASARGGIGGAALKAGARFAENNANQFYNDAFNRWNTENTNTYNRLAGISGLAQQGNALNAAAGMNYANQAGQNMIGAGNASAASTIGLGNIYGNALNQTVAYGNQAGWWKAPSGGSFGPALDPFFNGTGTSGD